MRIYNYIKDGICEPIVADNHKEADRKFIQTFDIKIDEIEKENKDQLNLFDDLDNFFDKNDAY
tara:strand:- start:21 stop:209 length:189 start_codon:yes stop_codon:yes gene_type:complete